MDYTETLYKHINGYNGLIINARLDRVVLQNGEHSLREVVEHPGGVTVLPMDENGYVYCVRQYRYPIGEHLLEVPAGKLEKGENPLDCAVRELSEETASPRMSFMTSERFILPRATARKHYTSILPAACASAKLIRTKTSFSMLRKFTSTSSTEWSWPTSLWMPRQLLQF
jgi:ADP-ribose pyrophosphatase YjhB (NUDIX family)